MCDHCDGSGVERKWTGLKFPSIMSSIMNIIIIVTLQLDFSLSHTLSLPLPLTLSLTDSLFCMKNVCKKFKKTDVVFSYIEYV